MNLKLKHILMHVVLSLPFFLTAHAQDATTQLADSARSAFEKQQYQTCIKCYQKIIQSGKTSYALYYNLGNAYYRNKQLGLAIYNFELAKKLNPFDEDVKNNLRIVSAKTIDKIDVKENYFVASVTSNIFSLYTTNGWAWLTIIFAALSMLGYLFYLFSNNKLMMRLGFWKGTIFLGTTIACFVIGFAALRNKNKKSQAIITAQVIQVLNAPNGAGKSQFTLHEGTKVNVLESSDLWTSIQLDNGNEGWVKTEEIGLF